MFSRKVCIYIQKLHQCVIYNKIKALLLDEKKIKKLIIKNKKTLVVPFTRISNRKSNTDVFK